MRLFPFSLFSLVLLAAGHSRAQLSEEPHSTPSETEPAPGVAAPRPPAAPTTSDTPVPTAPSATPSRPPATPTTSGAAEDQEPTTPASPEASEEVCGLGRSDGVDQADASTAADLVCDALHEQNAPMARTWGDGSQPVYRVHVRRLGSHILLGVTQEQPPGDTVRSRTLELASIEEAVQAAPRLAEALIKNVPVSQTIQADNQTLPEVTPRPKRGGYPQFEPGVVGLWAPGARGIGYGVELGFEWIGERTAAGLRLRGAGGDVSELSFVINGQYALTDGETAPVLGAGLGILSLATTTDDSVDSGGQAIDPDRSGAGPFLQLYGGVETLRTGKTRLNALLSVELPTFTVDRSGDDARYAPVVGIAAHVVF